MDGVERMHGYLASLRTYSRIGRLENDPEPVDLHELVDEAMCRLRPAIEATGARITVGALPTVTVERGQMTLVFESLLSNAVKFGGFERPAVTVTCERGSDAVEARSPTTASASSPAPRHAPSRCSSDSTVTSTPGPAWGLPLPARRSSAMGERSGTSRVCTGGRLPLRGSVPSASSLRLGSGDKTQDERRGHERPFRCRPCGKRRVGGKSRSSSSTLPTAP